MRLYIRSKLIQIAALAALCFGAAWPAAAQFTQVTGTVQDPNGIPYAGGTISAILVPGSSGGFSLSGQPYSGRVGPATLDSTGSFILQFGSNALITPASTQWQITVNSAAATIQLPLGTGPQSFQVTVTISGSSQSLTSTLEAAAPKLTNYTGSGSSGLSGMTAGQVPIAATSSTVTSSQARAGSGAAITTGPGSGVTSGDVTDFTGTAGQVADSGVVAANVVVASSPGAGIARFAGSTQTATSSELSGDATTSASNSVSVTGMHFGSTDLQTTSTAPTSGQCLEYNGTGITGGTCGGGTGLSGMTAGQVPIAATATTVTSSEQLAGSGAGITTGPASGVTSGHVTDFTGTAGQVADSGVVAANVVVASSPGAGIARFAGSTQTATSSELSGDAATSGSNSVSVTGMHFGSTDLQTTSTAPTSGQCLEYNGTGITGATCSGTGFANPMTTLGDLIYENSTPAAARLAGPTAVNSVVQMLTSTPSGGAAATPSWQPVGVPTNAQTGTSYTFLATDRANYVTFSNSSAIAVTLPQANSTGFGSNFVTVACDIGAGTATITPTTSTISYTTGTAYTSAASSLALSTGQCAWVYSDNTNYFAIVRAGTSGTVTSVAETVPSGFAVSGSPITSSGTLGITYSVSSGGQIIDSSASNTAGFTATPTLGASGTLGSITMGNATASGGTMTIEPVTGSGLSGIDYFPIPVNTPATLVQTICSGTITLPSGSAISSGAKFGASSTTPQQTACTNLATTDTIHLTFNADPTSTTGYTPGAMLTIVAYPTAGEINIYLVNNTGSSITPSSATVNYRVTR